MAEKDVSAAPEQQSRSETVAQIRKEFGRTQAELAAALGTATKTIQAYEQGWRKVPTRVLIQLFVLLAIYRNRDKDHTPCWDIMECPEEKRKQCPSHTMSDGQFCWFVGAQAGCRPPEESPDKLFPCMGCAVIRQLLREPTDSAGGSDGVPAPEQEAANA